MARMNALIPLSGKPVNVLGSLQAGYKFGNALMGGEDDLDETKRAYYEALTEKALSGDDMTPKDEAMIRYYDSLSKKAGQEKPVVDKIGAAKEAAIQRFLNKEPLSEQDKWLIRNSAGKANPIDGSIEPLPGPTPTPVPTQSIPAPEVPVSQAPSVSPVQAGVVTPSGRQEPPTQSLPGARVPTATGPNGEKIMFLNGKWVPAPAMQQ
jgi:hypothetical protein